MIVAIKNLLVISDKDNELLRVSQAREWRFVFKRRAQVDIIKIT